MDDRFVPRVYLEDLSTDSHTIGKGQTAAEMYSGFLYSMAYFAFVDLTATDLL